MFSFNTNDPIIRALIFYQALLVLKMMGMSVLTAMQRFKNKAFANPEDASTVKLKVKTHEDVERVRRAHLNDLENIPLFFVASWLYVMTNPSEFMAINLFRIFTVARFTHSFVYAVVVIPQPARALAFFAGSAIIGFMTVSSMLHFMSNEYSNISRI